MISDLWKNQVCRYLVIGAFNTVIGYLLYCLCLYLGFHYTWAVLISNVISVIINFNTQGRVVFKHFHRSQFIKYIALVVFNYFINILLIHLMSYAIPNYYLTGFIASLLLAINSYFVSKRFIFVK